MKKYYLTVNPYGGGKKGPKILKDVLPLFEQKNIELNIIETEYAGHNRDLANQLNMDGYDGFCRIGGDGTLNEAINGLLSRKDRLKFPIGLITGGTGNSFMHDLDCLDPIEAANKIGYPVVMKIASPQIVHKSDAGGVKVNLTNDEEIRNSFKEIVASARKYDDKAEIKGVLIVEMVKGGKEMIIGSKLEPGFGPVVMLGMGGIYVEILKDVTFRLAPFTDQEANDMISSIKTKKLLEGVRGEKPSDVEKLSECIQRLSQLVTDFREIKELDMNPVLVMEKGEGCKILDVRIGI